MDDLLSPNAAAAATLLLALWRWLAGSRASKLEARLREIARAAFELTRGAVALGLVDVERMQHEAKQRAHAMADRIGIKLPPGSMAMLDHFLDVAAAELAAEDRRQTEANLAKLAAVHIPTVEELRAEWAAAEQRGRARVSTGDDKPDVTIIAPEGSP